MSKGRVKQRRPSLRSRHQIRLLYQSKQRGCKAEIKGLQWNIGLSAGHVTMADFFVKRRQTTECPNKRFSLSVQRREIARKSTGKGSSKLVAWRYKVDEVCWS